MKKYNYILLGMLSLFFVTTLTPVQIILIKCPMTDYLWKKFLRPEMEH